MLGTNGVFYSSGLSFVGTVREPFLSLPCPFPFPVFFAGAADNDRQNAPDCHRAEGEPQPQQVGRRFHPPRDRDGGQPRHSEVEIPCILLLAVADLGAGMTMLSVRWIAVTLGSRSAPKNSVSLATSTSTASAAPGSSTKKPNATSTVNNAALKAFYTPLPPFRISFK